MSTILFKIFCITFIGICAFTQTGYGQTSLKDGTIAGAFGQKNKLIASDGAGQDLFGTAVAISGDTAVAGAYQSDVGGNSNQGAAYVYVRSGNGWVQQAKLIASDGAADDNFGYSVAISGDTILVGAVFKDAGGNTHQGAAYVFVRSGTNWSQQQKLLPADGLANINFGNNVALDGDTAIVGAQGGRNGANVVTGAAYVFTRSGTVWTQVQKLSSSDAALNDNFGHSQVISGDTLIVTAWRADIGGRADQGAAYVFTRSGGVFAEVQKFTSSDGLAGDRFGTSIGINGNTIVVGAAFKEIGKGAAYVFTTDGSVWTQQKILLAADGSANDNFGYSVAINGNIITVAAYADDIEGTDNGSVYVFKGSSNVWDQVQKILAADRAPSDYFGWSVAMGINTIVVGAPRCDVSGTFDEGAAYVFQVIRTPFDFDGDSRADFAVFRPDVDENNNYWYVIPSSTGTAYPFEWGIQTDKIAPGDFDGDGRTDFAVWREHEMSDNMALFYIYNSSDNSIRIEQFGLNNDKLTIGDWDGDGRSEVSVYREGPQSYFFYRASLNNPLGNTTYLPWGKTGDIPVPADYDGDGKMDAAVFRPSDETWYIRQSSDGLVRYEKWGLATDKLVPADYDGDGKTDLAVFRDGVWYIKQSVDNSPRYEFFGWPGDHLIPADYDGDGKVDIAVCRNGVWWVLKSGDGQPMAAQFGNSSDHEIPAAYLR